MRGSRAFIVLGMYLLAASAGSAQSGGGLEIRRSTIDAGGGELVASPLRAVGTIGQHDAQYSSNGSLSLRGGFWGAPHVVAQSLFSDGFE